MVCRHLRFGKRHPKIFILPHHLTGTSHFRRKNNGGSGKFVKWKDGLLDGPAIGKDLLCKSKVFQFCTCHYPGTKLREWYADRFTDKWNGTGSTRIDLNQKQFTVLDSILYIHEPHHFQSFSKGMSGFSHFIDHVDIEIMRR